MVLFREFIFSHHEVPSEEKKILSKHFLSNKKVLYIILQSVPNNHYRLIYFLVYQSIFSFCVPYSTSPNVSTRFSIYAREQNALSFCTQNAQLCLNIQYYPITGNI